MKQIHLTILLFFIISFNAFSQLTTFYIYPKLTDTSYAAAQDSHYVAVNPSVASNGKLLVFIGGTGSLTKHYKHIPQLAANLGYHSVSIAYPNSPSISASCGGSTNSSCYSDFRQEVCYGTPLNSSVSVDTLNCIYTRLVNLLNYLSATFPADGWNQFLAANQPTWNNIAVAGHSQGSGHALYFGYTQNCDRVLMFSGANDFSGFFNAPSPWVVAGGLTPPAKFYSFLHLQDDVFPYAKQYQVVQAAGMTSSGDDSTIVDNSNPPYTNSHCLYTNLTPLYSNVYSSWHGATAVEFYAPVDGTGQPVYDPVWTYMLTDQTTNSMNGIKNKQEISVFPNPASSEVTVNTGDMAPNTTLQIISPMGEMVLELKNVSTTKQLKIDVSQLPQGLYIIKSGSLISRLIKI